MALSLTNLVGFGGYRPGSSIPVIDGATMPAGDAAFRIYSNYGGAVQKATFAFIMQRSTTFDSENYLFFHTSDYQCYIVVSSSLGFYVGFEGGGAAFSLSASSDKLFVQVAIDTTQATASDRLKIYTKVIGAAGDPSEVTYSIDDRSSIIQNSYIMDDYPTIYIGGAGTGEQSSSNSFGGTIGHFILLFAEALGATALGADSGSGWYPTVPPSSGPFSTEDIYLSFANSGNLGNVDSPGTGPDATAVGTSSGSISHADNWIS